MPERVFGPASSHGVTVNAGSVIRARVRQESGVTQTLKHLRFGVAQLEPQGEGLVPLPDGAGGGIVVPPATHVYSAGLDNTARKIIVESQSQVWAVTDGNPRAVDVDDDGFVYTVGTGETLYKYDPDGNEVWSFTGHTFAINDVAAGIDGFTFSVTQLNVRKVDADGNQVWSFSGHSGGVRVVAVDLEGNVYSGGNDNTVRHSQFVCHGLKVVT